MGRRVLTPEEQALWRRVARHVRALRPEAHDEETVGPGSSASPPPGEKSYFPGRGASREPGPTAPKKPNPPADRGGERRVKRGQVELGGRIDLHGHTQDQARRALLSFLSRARADGARAVLVVTGKGGRLGEGAGVIKRRTPEWLASADFRPLVAGFAAAHRRHGGEGALYVFLRRA